MIIIRIRIRIRIRVRIIIRIRIIMIMIMIIMRAALLRISYKLISKRRCKGLSKETNHIDNDNNKNKE